MENLDIARIIAEKSHKLTQKCSGIQTDISNPEREKFLRVMSNMSEFFDKDISDEESTFKKLLFYRELAEIHQFYPDKNQIKTINGKFSDEPVIYVSYHVGGYRNVNYLLHLENINYCLAVSKLVIENQNSDYQKLHDTVINGNNSTSDFKVIDAENPSSLMQLIRYVKQEYSLLFYIDGNSGIGGMTRNDEKLIAVNFFNKKILSRKGIGFLSHFLKIPVVPIISYFEQDLKMSFDILEPISPNIEQSRDLSTIQTTQMLWNVLEKYLSIYPEQWEGWLYLNTFKVLDSMVEYEPSNCNKESTVRFNNVRYDFYKMDQYFLFDKYKIRSFKLQDVMFKFLSALKNHSNGINFSELKNLFPEKLLNQMIQTQILI